MKSEGRRMIPSFHLTAQNLPFLVAKLERLDPHKQWVVSVRERKSKRSQEQNERYWQFLTDFGRHLGYTKDEMHDVCRYKFLRNRVIVGDEEVPLLSSTTKLSTADMGEYMEAIERWAASLGFVWQEAA